MKIALIQETDKHTEIFGGLFQLLGSPKNKIDVYYKDYKSSFIKVYKKIILNQNPTWKITLHPDSFPEENNNYDLFIYTTGYEYEGNTPNTMTSLIIHIASDYKEMKQMIPRHIIALTPLIKQVPYFLNIFKAPIVRKKDKCTLHLFVSGLTNPVNKDLKGLYNLLENIYKHNYNNKIIVHLVNYYTLEKKYDKFIASGILDVHIDMMADKMLKLLSQSHFVLTMAQKNSSYHTRQLTGIIPLAISYGVPFITDKKLAKIYNVVDKSVVYTFHDKANSISRGVDKAIQIFNTDEYKTLQNKLIYFRDQTIIEQRKNNVFNK